MKKFLTFLLVFLCCANAAAKDLRDLDYRHFGLLPVLHEGRVKPLDTYARIMLRDLSGHDTILGRSAAEWLAEVLFDPANAIEKPVFRIVSPAAKERMGLESGKTLFSLSDLGPGLQSHGTEIEALKTANPETLTDEQKTLLGLYIKIETYQELLRTFSAFLPMNVEPPLAYSTGKTEYSYADFAADKDRIRAEILALAQQKGTDMETYGDDEKALVSLGFALEEIHEQGAQNNTLKIVQSAGHWLSPWEYLLQGGTLKPWQELAAAYRAGDKDAWRLAAKNIKGKTPLRIKLEKAYNITDPFESAMGFYLLGIIILAAEIYRKSRRMLFPFICFGTGLALQASGLIARIIILERPPVATLYESLLFVSLVCAAAGVGVFLRRKKSTAPLFAGPGSASFLLFIAPFLLQQGESMEMLVAVLNTNFWLGTHVLCITAGYGVCIITAVLAHAWFILRLRDAPEQKLKIIEDSVYKFSLAALLLTGIGTILGGIWADQSWGRFWGWDPKENGALLIVLWLIWAQHSRLAGRFGAYGFMGAMAFLNVVVALAWFGVNLLSVGLHSYGFISGIAFALSIFCVGEMLLIAGLWRLNVTKTKPALA